MPSATLVPITPTVLTWAIKESGLSRADVSERLKMDLRDLYSWEKGDAQPTFSEFRSLARVLRRQTAVFMLPEPPRSELPPLEFRGPPGALRASLNPDERRFVRQIARMQRVLAWIVHESGELGQARLPVFAQRDAPEDAASAIRKQLAIDSSEQMAWKSSSIAFRAWREALERFSVFVFVLPLGAESARGLSIWEASVPAVIVNSAWNVEARIFTIFHEVGHLIMRISSACTGYVGARADAERSLERWCDQFAASVLMPKDIVDEILRREFGSTTPRVSDLAIPSRVARCLRVSLRASVLRLIDLGIADRSLYGQIPETTDHKRNGGGKGRTRAESREDQFGGATKKAFARAVNEDLMTRADALTFLDIGDEDFTVRPGE